MKNDQVTGQDGAAIQLGKALPGRHLLDDPSRAGGTAYSVPGWYDSAPSPRNSPLRPRTPLPLPLRAGRAMDARPVNAQPTNAPVVESLPTKPIPAVELNCFSDNDDNDDSAGLITRIGCPRGWLISEAELARRFAKMSGRFEDIEEGTEADRLSIPAKVERKSAAGSYTSLFDLTPRRQR